MAAPARIILMRHGQGFSTSQFTGWGDPPLSPVGVDEAKQAGQRMKELGVKIDMVFCSLLERCVKSTWITCGESENFTMPIINSWRLNPRSYGSLQGGSREDMEEKFGIEQVEAWATTYHGQPPELSFDDERHPRNFRQYRDVVHSALPASESMAQTVKRVLPLWHDHIASCVAGGMNVFVCAHLDSLRALAKAIQGLDEAQTMALDFPPGIPLLCELTADLTFLRQQWLFDDVIRKKRMSADVRGGTCGGLLLRNMKSLAGSHIYDIVILGSGPAGVKAATEAGSRGQRVVVVDPKTMITGAPTGSHAKCVREAAIDGAKTWDEVQQVLDRTVKNVHHEATRVLRSVHVKHLVGRGFIVDENTVKVSTEGGVETVLKTSSIIIATGSKANRFPPVNFLLDGVYDSDTIGNMRRIPEVLVVQGAGIISVEYAVMFSKLGSKVILIDGFPAFLPMVDSALQAGTKKALEREGVELLMSMPFKTVDAAPGSSTEKPKIIITIEGRTIECDCLLCATGRSGSTSGLGLENLESKGVKINPRGKLVEVDKDGFTGCAHVYAVGDCATGSMGLATIGQSQAVRAAKSIFVAIGSSSMSLTTAAVARPEDIQDAKPFGVWTIPDMAWAGMTEEEAKKQSINYGVSVVKYSKSTRGCVTCEDGFLKLVYNREDGTVLGVHILGDNSCELIVYGAQAVSAKTTIFQMLRFVFPAVTYHNLYTDAAAEAKLRMSGVRSLTAATAWRRLQTLVERSLQQNGSEQTVSQVLRVAFEEFDTDKSGFLCKANLTQAVSKLGLEMSAADVNEMVGEATGDPKAEEIDYETFVAMLTDGLSVAESDENAVADCEAEHQRIQSKVASSSGMSLVETHYDLIVIGGGPAGTRAAEEGGSRGKRVLIIDPSALFTGLPTGGHSKCVRDAVLRGVKTWEQVQGVFATAAANAHAQAIRMFKTFHIEYKQGSATLASESEVSFRENGAEAETERFSFDNVVIATGSKANRFPPVNFDLPGVFDSDTIGGITYRPDTLVVQGSGIIGVEYAVMFAMLGTKVIVVDAFGVFLPMLDPDLKAACKKNLDDNGIEVFMNTPFKSFEAADGSTPERPKLRIDIGSKVLECDAVIAATGRYGKSAGLGLEALEAKGLTLIPRGKLIQVDGNGWTGCGGIYAVGDCATGSMGLATMGQSQAIRAVRRMFSASYLTKKRTYPEWKPFGVWTIPELAWAGITEDKAIEDKINYGVARADFSQTIRGCVSNEKGFLKMIFNRDSGVILGVHLCGENSCEVVNYGAELVNSQRTLHEVLRFVFPAVTYHNLYNSCATEGKISLRGVKDLSAAASWLHVATLLQNSLKAMNSSQSVKDALFKAFNQLDTDDSGFLSKEQLQNGVANLGLQVTEDHIRVMIKEATGDENAEECDYESFVKILS